MNNAIWGEWRHYESGYTRKWLCKMNGKKKCKIIKEDELPSLHINESKIPEGSLDALKKDLHLLKSACVGDGIIITRDKKIRDICSKYKKHIKPSKSIRWIIPDDYITECLEDL